MRQRGAIKVSTREDISPDRVAIAAIKTERGKRHTIGGSFIWTFAASARLSSAFQPMMAGMISTEPDSIGFQNGSDMQRIKACVDEINRLDFLLVAGAKRGSLPPPQKEIFDALSEATIVCADAIEAAGEPIAADVRKAIQLLQVAVTDLLATLKAYAMLVVWTPS